MINATQQGVIRAVAADIKPFGGYLACLTCGHERKLGNISAHLSNGWPRCCGHTMRWWTQRQIDAGEAPGATRV